MDGGIHPENPSFADKPVVGGKRLYWGSAYEPPKRFRGICQSGPRFPASTCNNKLIGARYFVDGFGAENVSSGDFLSPRDIDGHGSHTASTAAGNFGVNPTVFGNDLGVDLISGIAPRAQISHYKAFWLAANAEEGEGSESDIVAAIDQAVDDGVDVINASFGTDFSLGGTSPSALAFLRGRPSGRLHRSSRPATEGPGPVRSSTPQTLRGSPASVAPPSREFGAQHAVRQGPRRSAPAAAPRPGRVPIERSSPRCASWTPGNAAAPGVSAEDAARCLPDSLRRSLRGRAGSSLPDRRDHVSHAEVQGGLRGRRQGDGRLQPSPGARPRSWSTG